MTNQFRFDFGPEVSTSCTKEGYTKVHGNTYYEEKCGYGFLDGSTVYERDRGRPEALRQDFCIPVGAVFVVDLPNGNYTIQTLMGDLITSTCTGLKVGLGRLLLSDLLTAAGEFVISTFTVHVADGQLKLAFSGVAPRINALEITAAPQAATLYLVGRPLPINRRMAILT